MQSWRRFQATLIYYQNILVDHLDHFWESIRKEISRGVERIINRIISNLPKSFIKSKHFSLRRFSSDAKYIEKNFFCFSIAEVVIKIYMDGKIQKGPRGHQRGQSFFGRNKTQTIRPKDAISFQKKNDNRQNKDIFEVAVIGRNNCHRSHLKFQSIAKYLNLCFLSLPSMYCPQ